MKHTIIIYRYQICIFMHDLINSRLPHTVKDHCSFLEHPYETRNKEKGNLKVATVHIQTLESNRTGTISQ